MQPLLLPSFLSFHLHTLSSSSPPNPLRLLADITTLSFSSSIAVDCDFSPPSPMPALRLRLLSDATDSSLPLPAPSLRLRLLANFFLTKAISGWHCLVVGDYGRAYAWGGNEYGQCGEEPERKDEGRTLRRDIVIPQRCAPQLTVRQAAIGGWHCLAADDYERAYAWGGKEYGQCGEEPKRKDEGRTLRRDIVIPQRCTS